MLEDAMALSVRLKRQICLLQYAQGKVAATPSSSLETVPLHLFH